LARPLVTIGGLAAIVCAGPAGATVARRNIDWPGWGNTSANTHFAALAQVNTSNVRSLRVAWTGEEGPYLYDWETFPIVVGTTMYYDTDTDDVLAVNAVTGHVLWSYSPQISFLGGGLHSTSLLEPVSRGVSYGAGRIYLLTYYDHLVALDALTGKRLWAVRVANPSEGFSENSP